MLKDSGRNARDSGRGWNGGRMSYTCADYADVPVLSKSFRWSRGNSESESASGYVVLTNVITYTMDRDGDRPEARALISEVEFSRDMSQITGQALRIATKNRSARLRSPYRSSVTSVTVPAGVRILGKEAFSDCERLRSVVFRNGSELQAIGRHCFWRSGLRKIVIPSGVTEIADGAFSHCGKLSSISFQEGSRLRKIGAQCFCRSCIEEFRAPPGLLEIGKCAFRNCRCLRFVSLNEGEAVSGNEWCEGAGPRPVLRQLMPGVFQGCERLKEVRLPWQLECIGQHCFCGTGLEKFIAPVGLKRIDAEAFLDCVELERVSLNPGLEVLGEACTG